MKELSISEVFCEILSGIVVLLVAAPLLHLLGAVTIDRAVEVLATRFTVAHVAGALVLAYLFGLVMDAVGLAIGEWCLDGMIDSRALNEAETEQFWTAVPEHVLKYRVLQWSYYSTYRNLFVLLIPGTLLWTIVAARQRGCLSGIAALASGVALEIVFWRSMVALLGIYFQLGKHSYTPKEG